MRLYRLYNRLYIRPHTRHMNSSNVLAALSTYETKLMLNVALINDDTLAAAARTVGLEYRHEPMNDSGGKMDPPRIRRIAGDIVQAMQNGTVVVNCDSGWNRSALVAVRAIMMIDARSAKEIIKQARLVRGDGLLKNWAFENWLLNEAR